MSETRSTSTAMKAFAEPAAARVVPRVMKTLSASDRAAATSGSLLHEEDGETRLLKRESEEAEGGFRRTTDVTDDQRGLSTRAATISLPTAPVPPKTTALRSSAVTGREARLDGSDVNLYEGGKVWADGRR